MAFTRTVRPRVAAGCVTCGSAQLSPRRWGGPRLRRDSRARLQTPPCCAASPPRAGESRARRGKRGAAQSAAPGGGGRTVLALRRRAGDGTPGAGEEAAGGWSCRPSVSAPRHFARREVALLPAAPPGRRRPGRELLPPSLSALRFCPRRPPRSSGGLTRCCQTLLFLLAGVAALGRSSGSRGLRSRCVPDLCQGHQRCGSGPQS